MITARFKALGLYNWFVGTILTREVQRRLAEFDSGAAATVTWEQVKAETLRRVGADAVEWKAECWLRRWPTPSDFPAIG